MHIRTIRPTEVHQFAAIAPHSLGAEGFARYIQELWERGTSRPDRCFIVEEHSEMIGRIMYRGTGEEVNFTGLHLPWQSDFLAVGQMLLRHSLASLQTESVTRIEALVTSAWGYADHVHTLIRSLRLPLIQTKTRYIWHGTPEQIAEHEHLQFFRLHEVGEAAFLDLIQRTSVDTLDSLDRVQIEELGAEQHAQDYLHMLKTEFEHHPEWWLAVYDLDRKAVGHVIGVPFNLHRQEGAIGYIGIVPEQRGKGYIDHVLRVGMRAMLASGLTTIIADTDVQNVPMQRAFERCSYVRGDTTWVYHDNIANILK